MIRGGDSEAAGAVGPGEIEEDGLESCCLVLVEGKLQAVCVSCLWSTAQSVRFRSRGYRNVIYIFSRSDIISHVLYIPLNRMSNNFVFHDISTNPECCRDRKDLERNL